MSIMDDFLKDYIFSGMDDEDLTDNTTEVMRFIYGDEYRKSDLLPVWDSSSEVGDSDHYRENISDTSADTQHFKNVNEGISENTKSPSTWERLGFRANETPKKWTEGAKKDAIIYSMRDSMYMSTFEFAQNYNPTTPWNDKNWVLINLEALTIVGIVDIDWAITLLGFSFNLLPTDYLYKKGKPFWNRLRGLPRDYNYMNDREKNAIIMSRLMMNGTLKFHDFFPWYLKDALDKDYKAILF